MQNWGLWMMLLAAGSQILLAAALVAFKRRTRATVAYAVMLGFWSMVLFLLALGVLLPLEQGKLAVRALGFFVMALPLAVVYFAGNYPERRSWMPAGSKGIAPLAAVAGVAWIALWHNPHLTFDLSAYEGTLIAPVDAAVPKGPLILAMHGFELLSAVTAMVMLRQFLATDAGISRNATALVSLGFFVPSGCTCAIGEFLLRLQDGALFRPGYGISATLAPFYDTILILQLLMVATLVVMAVRAARRGDAVQRRNGKRFGGLIGLSVAAALVIGALPPESNAQYQALYFILAFWALVGSALVVYGVLKYQVFDIDLRLKKGISRATVGSIIAAAAFVGSELIEAAFAVDQVLPGLAIAAAGTLAVRPLTTVGNRLADAVVPGVQDTSAYRDERALDVYRAAFEGMVADGQVTTKEQGVLDTLAAQLGLTDDARAAIERATHA